MSAVEFNKDKYLKIVTKKLDKIKDDPTFEIISYKRNLDDVKKLQDTYLVAFKSTGGYYKNQVHLIEINLIKTKYGLETFPTNAPSINFITNIFHTNVSPKNGYICLDILNSKWSPMYNIDAIIQNIILLMDSPSETGGHLNPVAAKLQQSGQKNFNKKIKNIKERYGKEYDNIYNSCFKEFNDNCRTFYINENEKIIKSCAKLFSKFNILEEYNAYSKMHNIYSI